MRIRQIMIFLFAAFMMSAACNKQQTVDKPKTEEQTTVSNQKKDPELRPDLKKYYDKFGVDGVFILYDQSSDKYTIYNPDKARQPFIPASTFKIINSLIGIETGVIKDENFVIPWDGEKRWNENWNKDHDLKTAYKNSTVWYYQELARRVGGEKMKHYLGTVKYGNADTSGGIDKFWLSGGIRITPEEQIDFLKQLHDNKLPFSSRTTDIVKNIMIAKDTLGYTVRAKTGWGFQDKNNIGWYVGYVETKDNVYYFANCIQLPQTINDDNFAKARIEIVYDILDELKIIPK